MGTSLSRVTALLLALRAAARGLPAVGLIVVVLWIKKEKEKKKSVQ